MNSAGCRDITKRLLYECNQFCMINGTCGNNTEVIANITILHKIKHMLAGDITDRALIADNGFTQWMTRPKRMGEEIMNRVFRAVINHGDFL